MSVPAYDRLMSRFWTLSAKSRASLNQNPVTQSSPQVQISPLAHSRFGTLSDKSRASLSRAKPAPQASQSTASPAAPSPGISVDEAWEVFGIVKKRATQDEVKAKHKKLAAKFHPDRNPGNEAVATQQMVRVNLAYAALKRHCRWD